jgi:PST family polysaccharide transporter
VSTPVTVEAATAPSEAAPPRSSYGQIFRSTALIGGASGITILLGIVRTKFMALWLGPAGVGLMGVYYSITELASTAAGMGVGSSGVRQIAEAGGSGDEQRIARTIKTLRRVALVLGVLGAVALAVFSHPISKLTFGDTQHAWAVAVLAVTVFFSAVSGGQAALIQGMRRIADLARMRVLGALCGTVIGLAVIWVWREAGIVPLLVILSVMALLTSWWFARRIPVSPVTLGLRETAQEARGLLSLGLVFVASALMSAGVAYFTRMIVIRELGLVAVGHYTAAFTLAGLYVGFILQAMGTDFYPRLTAVARDNEAVNRMVNEQTEISLLLAVPGILATLTFAAWVIALFYSGKFEPAGEVLRWQVLGVLGRVVSWPMGFILLAKGSRRMFLITEVASNVVHVALLWWGVRIWGLSGTGMAFFGLYVFYLVMIIVISRRESGFRWSAVNTRLLGWMLPAVATVFAATTVLPPVPAMAAGGLVTAVCGWVCFKGLLRRFPKHRLGFLARWVT